MANSIKNTGKVKFFNENKGFGFIKDAKADKDYFFHFSGIVEKGKVKKDDQVSFELENGQKGLKAVNIRRIEESK